MQTPSPTPKKVIRENVTQLEVAKYYLKVEFTKLFPDASLETIQSGIDNLKDKNIYPLLEAMSFTYHLNGVFYNLTKEGYIWNEETWDVSELILTGMDPNVNKVIFSDEVNGDALKFKKYLRNYFENNTVSDPEGLFSYMPSSKEIYFPKLLMKEKDGKVLMLDGSHRLTEMLLNDVETVHAFVGHPVISKKEEDRKVHMGGSTFIMLTIAYKNGNAEERNAVLTVVRQLIKRSLDGKDQVQKYWVDRQRDEEVKKAGEELLNSLVQG